MIWFNEDIKQDIYIAIEEVKKSGFGNNYCLCHGDIGNLLILKYASQILKDETLRIECLATAENFINNFFTQNWNSGELKQTEDMSLMIGLSGVGYGLLQLLEPELFPNILCIE